MPTVSEISRRETFTSKRERSRTFCFKTLVRDQMEYDKNTGPTYRKLHTVGAVYKVVWTCEKLVTFIAIAMQTICYSRCKVLLYRRDEL